MKKFLRGALKRKVCFTLLIMIVYMIGRKIPIPLVKLTSVGLENELLSTLDLLSEISGGDLTQMSLFSIGLNPWMNSMIIWQFLAMAKLFGLQELSQTASERKRLYLCLFLATIQSAALLQIIELSPLFPSDLGKVLSIACFMIISVTGSFVLMWLVLLNSRYGLGGATIIILINLLGQFSQMIGKLLGQSSVIIICLLLILAIVSYIIIGMHRAEYRIPLNSLMITNQDVYIPFKLNPAGSMPVMYATTIFLLPQLLLLILLVFLKVEDSERWMTYFSMQHLIGVLLYNSLLFLLSFGFAYLNTVPEEVAKQLQKGGDFIDGLLPGKETEMFLNRTINRLASIGGVYLVCLAGVPMLLPFFLKDSASFVFFPSTLLMAIPMILNIFDEVQILRIDKRYNAASLLKQGEE